MLVIMDGNESGLEGSSDRSLTSVSKLLHQ